MTEAELDILEAELTSIRNHDSIRDASLIRVTLALAHSQRAIRELRKEKLSLEHYIGEASMPGHREKP